MLNVVDEFTRECVAIRVARQLKSTDVINVLSDLLILRGVPNHVRSDTARNPSPKPHPGVEPGVGANAAVQFSGSTSHTALN